MLTNTLYHQYRRMATHAGKRKRSMELTPRNQEFFDYLLKAFLAPGSRYIVHEGRCYPHGHARGFTTRTVKAYHIDTKRIAIIFDKGLFSVPLHGLSYIITKSSLHLFSGEKEWFLTAPCQVTEQIQ